MVEIQTDKYQTLTPIGLTDYRGEHIPFYIKDADRTRSIFALGKSGQGKTTLLLNMAISDLQKGKTLIVIDPHADACTTLLDYVPKEVVHKVVYFNAADTEHPIAFNPLYNIPLAQHHIVAANLLATFKRIFELHNTPRLDYILTQCIITLLHYPNATLLDIQPLLTNKDFRQEVLRHVADIHIKNFWYSEYDKYPPAFRIESISPVLNKVNVFITNPILRNIVGQQGSINIKEIIDSGGILLCNLSKGVIGEDTAALLGSMLLSTIQQTMLQRATQPAEKRTHVYCYVDEAHTFLNSASAAVSMLAECRKFGLSLFLTHQYLEQLPKEIQTAVFGNVGTLISFQIGNNDAEVLATEFAPVFSSSDFINLPKYSFYIKLMIDGQTSKGFSALSLPLPPVGQSYTKEIIAFSRSTYSVAKEIMIDMLPVFQERPAQNTLF